MPSSAIFPSSRAGAFRGRLRPCHSVTLSLCHSVTRERGGPQKFTRRDFIRRDFIRFPESEPGKGEEDFLIQKQTLELFLERGAISREQYEKSLGELERTGKGDEKREKTGEPLDKQG